MTVVNHPEVVAELTELYGRYEKALCENDLTVLDELFWDAPEVVRFGATENLYGIDAVRQFRQQRSPKHLAREIANLKVVTFGFDTGTVTLEFYRSVDGVMKRGRQSQTWCKLPEGWRIVSAHVSWLAE